MPSNRKANPWNLFVKHYYAEHQSGHKKSLKEAAKLYKEHQKAASSPSKHHSTHSVHKQKPESNGPRVIAIETSCAVCDQDVPEVFTQEPMCELDVSKANPIVRYSVFGQEYCALASNLVQYFNTKLVVDSVGIRTRTGRVTAPVGQKRGPIEPYSRLPFSQEDYKRIKDAVKKSKK